MTVVLFWLCVALAIANLAYFVTLWLFHIRFCELEDTVRELLADRSK